MQSGVAVRDEEARAATPAARMGEAGKGPPAGVPGGDPLLRSRRRPWWHAARGAWLFKLKAKAASHRGLQLAESGEALGFPGPITAFTRPLTPAAQGEQRLWGAGASVVAGWVGEGAGGAGLQPSCRSRG